MGEVGDELGDAAAGGVDLDGHADGVAVVFYAEDDGELLVGGGVERLPELALRRGALADAGEDDFVVVELNVVEGAIVAESVGFRCGLGMMAEIAAGLGCAGRRGVSVWR